MYGPQFRLRSFDMLALVRVVVGVRSTSPGVHAGMHAAALHSRVHAGVHAAALHTRVHARVHAAHSWVHARMHAGMHSHASLVHVVRAAVHGARIMDGVSPGMRPLVQHHRGGAGLMQ